MTGFINLMQYLDISIILQKWLAWMVKVMICVVCSWFTIFGNWELQVPVHQHVGTCIKTVVILTTLFKLYLLSYTYICITGPWTNLGGGGGGAEGHHFLDNYFMIFILTSKILYALIANLNPPMHGHDMTWGEIHVVNAILTPSVW